MAMGTRAGRAAKAKQQRYRDIVALRAAVRRACIEHAEAGFRATTRGHTAVATWNDARQRDLDESLTVSEAAHALCMRLRKVLGEAREFIRANANLDDGYAEEIRRVVKAAAPHPPLSSDDKLYTARQMLVAEYDGPHRQWWSGIPRNKDLAALSLLAGQFPQAVRSRLRGTGVTANEVIQAEERAISNERSTYGFRSKIERSS